MRTSKRRAVGALVGFVLLSAAAVPWSSEVGTTAAARDMQNEFWPPKGGKQTRVRHHHGPQEIRILTVNPAKGPRIDIATAGQKFPMYKWTSGMSNSAGAVAGVNGDF